MPRIARAPRNLYPYVDDVRLLLPAGINVTWQQYRLKAPDGTPTGNFMYETASGVASHYFQKNLIVNTVEPITISAYFRAENRSWCWLRHNGYWVWADLQNGVLGSSFGGPIATGIIPCPNDWYRVWLSSFGPQAWYRYGVATGDTNITFIGLDQDSIGFWRPQLNFGIGPDPHDSIPILSNANLINDLDLRNWPSVGSTVDATPITGPDGTLNAYRVNDLGGATRNRISIDSNTADLDAPPTGGDYVYYMFVREGTAADLSLVMYDATAAVFRIEVDFGWVAGNLTVLAQDIGDGAAVDMGGGWWIAWVHSNSFVAGNRINLALYPTRRDVDPGAAVYTDVVAGKCIAGTGPSDIIAQEVPRT